MATTELRAMSTGEILDASFALVRRHAAVLFGIAIVCQGVPSAIGLYVQFGGGVEQHLGLYLLGQVLNIIGYLLVSGAVIWVVSEAYLGRETALGDALRYAAGRMGRNLAAAMASGILVMLAALLLIIPGIIVACGLSVAVQAAVLEPLKSGTDGVGRSWSLTKGYRGKALGLYFVVFAVVMVVFIGAGLVVGVAAAFLPILSVPALIVFTLISLLVYPFSSCVFTLFYYDLRVRKEAFDLEVLSQHIGLEPAGA